MIFFALSAPIGVVLTGVVIGAVTGLLAVGLVLVFRTSRIVNFAYGSIGGVGGILAVSLFRSAGWNYFLAMGAGVLAGAGVGALVERLAIRRFERAPRLILTVATIGLAQVLGAFELTLPKLFGDNRLVLGGFQTPIRFSLKIEPVVLTGSHLLVLLAVPVVLAALAFFLGRTGAGLALRGAAENTDRARLAGIPVHRLSTLVWALAGALSALTFVLRAPFQGTVSSALAGPALLLPGLAAAVVARMESLPVAFAAGIGLGVLEQLVLWNVAAPSATDVVFLVVILVALLARPDPAWARSATAGTAWPDTATPRPLPSEWRRLAEVRVARGMLLGLLSGAALLLGALGAPSLLNLSSVALVWAIVALSLVVLTGWAGHASLGQFAVAGVGAALAGNLIARDVDLFVALLAAGAAGAGVALLVGLPALRIRGPFLAVTTLALALALDSYFLNPAYVRWVPESLVRPVLFGRVPLESERATYLLCLAFFFLAILLCSLVRRARAGRVLLATRDNPAAATAAGVSTTAVRLSGFALSGVIAGVAGGLHVLVLHGARAGSYPPSASLEVFSMAVVGGLGSIWGAIGGVIGLRAIAQAEPAVRLFITGIGVLVVLLLIPGGLAQAAANLRDRALLRWARYRGYGPPLAGIASAALDRRVPPRTGTAAQIFESGAGSAPPLLRCRRIAAAYGKHQVLFSVDLEVQDGEVLALLGTNGAGKSTLLRVVAGLLGPTSGSVEMAGENLRGEAAEEVARRGVALMVGGRGVFPSLTVEENLRLAGWQLHADPERLGAATEEAMSLFPALQGRQAERAGNLSGGEQQMLALAGCLLVRPRLLLLDELSLGLSPATVARLLEAVRQARQSGTAVVVVEQSVNVALATAERAVFLEKGEVRFCGPTADLLERPEILRSVFLAGAAREVGAASSPGPSVAPRPAEAGKRPPAELVLECRGVSRSFGGIRALRGVDLSARRGSIVGILGPNGAGKTTLFDCISGFLPLDEGRISLGGRQMTDWTPAARARAGLGRSFQDARLYPSLTVAETIAVSFERHLPCRNTVAAALHLPASFESEDELARRVERLVELLGLVPFRDRLVSELSSGTRRVVELACALAQDPEVLLLDEPSAGVAQREVEALAPLLVRVRDVTGCALVVIEHDVGLLASICEELVALDLGLVVARGAPADVLQHPRVVESYLGSDLAAVHRSGPLAHA